MRVNMSAIGSVMLMQIFLFPLVSVDVEDSSLNCHTPWLYQLALRTPGIIPESASSLKQILQSPNRRRYARERPQREQRFFARVVNFGFRFAFSIIDFGGITVSSPLSRGTACRAPSGARAHDRHAWRSSRA